MPKLKTLSGADISKIFADFGFSIAARKGSHAKLRRILPDGTKQILTIPLHEELDKGTLTAIYKQALRYVPETELRSHFYST